MTNAHEDSAMLNAAVELAKLGLKVFPLHYPASRNGSSPGCSCHKPTCDSIGKHPLLKRWQELASTDSEAIRSMWERSPNANIGVAGGEPADMIDVDGKLGEDSMIGLETLHSRLPDTWRVRTGSGGRHIYFRATGRLRNRVRFAPGLDVRTTGGFVVGVGSLHASGKRYEWEPGYSPADCELADMPEWLIAEITAETESERQPQGSAGCKPPPEPYCDPSYWLEHFLKGVEQGNRNGRGFGLACQLLDNVYQFSPDCETELLEVMKEYARRCPGTGYTGQEAVASFNSALSERRKNGFREPSEHGPAATDQATSLSSRILTLSDLLTGDLLPIDWVADDIIPLNGITILGGDAGVGKSWLAYHLALSVAAGMPFLGHFSTRQANVLVFDAESGENLLRRRLKKLHAGATAGGVSLTTDLPVRIIAQALRLDKPESVTKLLIEHSIGLVIADPLIHSLPPACSENDSIPMAQFFEKIRRIQAATGACFVFTHHSRKQSAMNSASAGQMLRGSSAIRGILDSHLFLRMLRPGRVKCEHDKSRHAEAVRPFIIEIEDPDEASTVVRYAGLASESEGDKMAIATAFVVDALADADGSMYLKDILKQAKGEDITERTVQRALGQAVKAGTISRRKEGRECVYSLTDQAESQL